MPDDPRTPDPGVNEPERARSAPEPGGVGEPAVGEPADDEFANLVLDDSFVRGGSYEPPARTRVAIARYGGQQTSWRHGGGLAARGEAEPEPEPARKPRRRARSTSDRVPRAAANRSVTAPTPLMEKLPIIVAVVVVAVFAFLMFS